MLDPVSLDLRNDPDAQQARKFPVVHQVEVAASSGLCETLEGDVVYQPGDAIVTGVGGESWPVSREYFFTNYEAVPPTVFGKDGCYRKKPIDVWVKKLDKAITIYISGGKSTLNGKEGDWLVQYAPQNHGVVAQNIFEVTYELLVD